MYSQASEQIIYFDLDAGSVTINASTYTGYVYLNGDPQKVTGSHSSTTKYYVYQSSSNTESPGYKTETGYTSQEDFNAKQNIRIPDYSAMQVGAKPWGTYSIFPNDAWNWAYDKIEPQQNLRLGETGNYEFLFDMNHINGAEVPQHDERQPEKE